MEKYKKIKIIMLSAIIIAVIGLTVAFAALSKTLTINGSGTVDKANWDIHFKNVTFLSKTQTATVTGTPSPTNTDKGPTISGLAVTLKQPGDYVSYTADIENSGDMDAEIALITPPSLTSAQQTLFDFDVVYTGTNNHPSNGDMLSHTSPNNVRNITITFKYKDSVTASQLPSTAQSIPLSYSIQYVQSFRTTTTVTTQASQTYNVGDKFCLNGNVECFYTISDNGSTVTALAEWNLDIDNTGIQNSNYKGCIKGCPDSSSSLNWIVFSSYPYWGGYPGNYPKFVFDNNSNLWTPIQNYQTYLRNTLGKTSATASLLSYEQATEALGCEVDNMCPSTRPWVYQTSYWLGSANDSWQMWVIYLNNEFGFSSFGQGYIFGVRPVITISKSEL